MLDAAISFLSLRNCGVSRKRDAVSIAKRVDIADHDGVGIIVVGSTIISDITAWEIQTVSWVRKEMAQNTYYSAVLIRYV